MRWLSFILSRESGTLCSFNLENNTTFTGIKTFDPRAYAASLWSEFMPESSWQYIITFLLPEGIVWSVQGIQTIQGKQQCWYRNVKIMYILLYITLILIHQQHCTVVAVGGGTVLHTISLVEWVWGVARWLIKERSWIQSKILYLSPRGATWASRWQNKMLL